MVLRGGSPPAEVRTTTGDGVRVEAGDFLVAGDFERAAADGDLAREEEGEGDTALDDEGDLGVARPVDDLLLSAGGAPDVLDDEVALFLDILAVFAVVVAVGDDVSPPVGFVIGFVIGFVVGFVATAADFVNDDDGLGGLALAPTPAAVLVDTLVSDLGADAEDEPTAGLIPVPVPDLVPSPVPDLVPVPAPVVALALVAVPLNEARTAKEADLCAPDGSHAVAFFTVAAEEEAEEADDVAFFLAAVDPLDSGMVLRGAPHSLRVSARPDRLSRLTPRIWRTVCEASYESECAAPAPRLASPKTAKKAPFVGWRFVVSPQKV